MTLTVYNKLVRDRIPEIIADQGQIPHTRVLDEGEYLDCLERKLDEECEEFHRQRELEELADVLEVVYALADAIADRQALEEIYRCKHERRGGFRDRVFLISKE